MEGFNMTTAGIERMDSEECNTIKAKRRMIQDSNKENNLLHGPEKKVCYNGNTDFGHVKVFKVVSENQNESYVKDISDVLKENVIKISSDRIFEEQPIGLQEYLDNENVNNTKTDLLQNLPLLSIEDEFSTFMYDSPHVLNQNALQQNCDSLFDSLSVTLPEASIERNLDGTSHNMEDRIDQTREMLILKSITFTTKNVLLVWNTKEGNARPDFIVTTLDQKLGTVLDVQDRWKTSECSPENPKWIGSVVTFLRPVNVLTAPKVFWSLARSIKTITLKKFLQICAIKEVNHQKLPTESRKLIISSKKSLKKVEDIEELKSFLFSLGTVEDISFPHSHRIDKTILTPEVICEVTFSYVTQAIAAQIVLHQYFMPKGRLYVTFNDSLEGDLLMHKIQEHLHSHYFCENFRFLSPCNYGFLY